MKDVTFNWTINDSYSMEAFKALRTNIQFCGADVKVIDFTSCRPNDGKSTVCLELARSFAYADKKVLVIDADMRLSVIISKYTEEYNLPGLSQYLSGLESLDNVKYRVDNNFDIIFAGAFPPNPAELLGAHQFRDLIEAERDNYDYILIDTPPLGLVIDSAVIATVSDGVVLVVSSGNVKSSDLIDVKQQLEKTNCRILGVVLNHNSKRNKSKKRSGYYGKYGNSYGGYIKEDDKANKQ